MTAGYRGIPAPALVSGSVESVAQQFAQLAALGYTDVIVRHLTNDQPKVLASLARLNAPDGVAVTASGGFLIADTNNNLVRFVDADLGAPARP